MVPWRLPFAKPCSHQALGLPLVQLSRKSEPSPHLRDRAMSVSYRFNKGLIEFSFTGSTPAHNVFEMFQKAYEDPGCPEEASLLIDTRESKSLEVRSLATIKGYADFILKHPKRPGVRRVAVLVPGSMHERYSGLTRTMGFETQLSIRLFDDESNARQWLSEVPT